jgi:alpha-ketoglutarate-dependent taurine dioxygenase
MPTQMLTSGATSIAVIETAGNGEPGDGDERAARLSAVSAAVEELLLDHGAVLLRGLGVRDAAGFHEVVSFFGRPFEEYRGNSPRQAVHDGVWTSTDYPAEYDISLHNELSQAAVWPARLFFCCLTSPRTGGETPVSDGRAMLAGMDPAVRARFGKHGVAYLQNLHSGYGPGRSWQDTYETDDPGKVEAYLRESDAVFAWTEDEDLRIRQVRPATRRHPVTGEEVWFNQAEQFDVSSLPAEHAEALLALASSRDELPQSAAFGDGSSIPAQDLEHVREVARRGECSFRWRPGDILAIDNMLVMHGRHAYTGSRKILVAMT